ncbi:murein L,D-transpeptidase catalytic domain family protein [Sphingomonas oligophenolica]|uniref:Transcriptional initiation protein Tat n=1 Tax=Sphingomonas oligophenolica TaxID=301154 RepID=A0A502CNS4_9SPHN|nr:murein L,D-transpeptidase catalytic domain family protein [Sphingomonas oligophenolica]TPG15305.1 transcriptional initiation protein Tat [Sphingomonas oligophenolica]
MTIHHDMARDRRAILKNGLVLVGALAVPSAVSAAARKITQHDLKPLRDPPVPTPAVQRVAAAPITSPRVVRPDLMRRAVAALDRHSARIPKRDRIVIADMAAPSSQPRFHFVDLASGQSKSFLVTHGSGSDPAHTGWLQRFSNDPGSNATSEGAFLASNYYVGKHGNSQRLLGLDPTNDNALSRAIVVHSAWYANKDMIKSHGQLGRSQGCFAVGESDLDQVFAMLGSERMIYAAKV